VGVGVGVGGSVGVGVGVGGSVGVGGGRSAGRGTLGVGGRIKIWAGGTPGEIDDPAPGGGVKPRTIGGTS
jgi:hypothetical protein